MTAKPTNISFSDLKALLEAYETACKRQIALFNDNATADAIALNDEIDRLQAEISAARSCEPALLAQQLTLLYNDDIYAGQDRPEMRRAPLHRVLANLQGLTNSLVGEPGDVLPVTICLPRPGIVA